MVSDRRRSQLRAMTSTMSVAERMDFCMQQPWAVPNRDNVGAGREHEESQKRIKERRTRFAVDIDRLIHSPLLRGLEKTQVYTYGTRGPNGHRPATRWNHTMEVANLARNTARVLQANEDLAFALSIGHDQMHPPYGHQAEVILNDILQDAGIEEGFNHNNQLIEVNRHLWLGRQHRGHNLCRETLKGFDKKGVLTDVLPEWKSPSVAAQIMDIADAICYRCRDLYDGQRMGAFKWVEAQQLDIIKEAEWDGDNTIRGTVSSLFDLLAIEMQDSSLERLKQVKTLSDVVTQEWDEPLVDISPRLIHDYEDLGQFLREEMYKPDAKTEYSNVVEKITRGLIKVFATEDISRLKAVVDVPKVSGLRQQRAELNEHYSPEQQRLLAAKDYFVLLTDAEATAMAKALHIIDEKEQALLYQVF